MTITSIGYEGTVGEAQFAQLLPRAGGTHFGVDDFASFRVTVAGGTRALSVAAGVAWATGVMATSNAVESLALAPVPSGTRWDMIVLRYNWSTNLTQLAVITGGSNKALPSRQNTPGTVVEQPLALCRVQADQPAVQDVVDLRVISGDGGCVAFDELVLQYFNRVGSSVRIGEVRWDRVLDATNSPRWVSSSVGDTGWVGVTRGPGWANGGNAWHIPRVRRVGSVVMLRGLIRNASTSSVSASVARLLTVPGGFRPVEPTPLGMYHASNSHIAELLVSDTGVVSVFSDYYTNSLPTGQFIPLHGQWFVG